MTVTAINTIEDLVRIMDDHPDWVEAMRVRLLSREILELPQTVAVLAETVESFAASTEKRLDTIEASLAQHDARFDAVDARFNAVDARFDAVDARFDTVDSRFDAADSRFESVEYSIRKLRTEIAPMKAAHARNAATEDAALIAGDLGLKRTGTLTRDELWEIAENADTSNIPTNELRSFRRADLILEAVNQTGDSCFIAVEISFTANGRDTDRAIRNAGFLEQFTGRRSIAAVAGLYKDNRIDEALESGSVYWHQLDAEQLEVE